jgi:hypothetical protein
MRGRGNGRNKMFTPRGQTFESNGPEVKVRGNAQQVVERYLALARDASSAGDRVAAENYLQHAEHYYRMLNAHGQQGDRDQHQRAPHMMNDGMQPMIDRDGGGSMPPRHENRPGPNGGYEPPARGEHDARTGAPNETGDGEDSPIQH